MCDCPRGKRVIEVTERDDRETVTIFQKCPKSYHPGRDTFDRAIFTADSQKNDSKPMEFLRPDYSHTICVASKSTDSETFTDSSRTYKFVSPREHDLIGEGEEEIVRPAEISFEPCRKAEEVEEEADIECTLAIVKPEAIVYRKEIERHIFEEGFEIYRTRWLQLTPEQVSEFYSDKYGQLNFAHLVAYMASGPIIVHVLAKHRAVDDWRTIIGPTKVTEARLYFPESLRAKYGRRGEDFKNAVHGSDSREQAEREIHFFFPEMIIEPLLKGEVAVDYLWESVNPILVEGLTQCCKVKPAEPILWLANWLLLNNPNKPKLPEDLALIA